MFLWSRVVWGLWKTIRPLLQPLPLSAPEPSLKPMAEAFLCSIPLQFLWVLLEGMLGARPPGDTSIPIERPSHPPQ